MIIEWIKLNVFKVILLLFVLSLVGNVFLATWKGINIKKEYTTQIHTHMEQFQGQLSMNMWMSQGNKVVWKYELIDGPKKVVDKLNSLPPQYSYFAEVPWCGSGVYTIFWPEFMEEKVKK